jgi:hypothetical protein
LALALNARDDGVVSEDSSQSQAWHIGCQHESRTIMQHLTATPIVPPISSFEKRRPYGFLSSPSGMLSFVPLQSALELFVNENPLVHAAMLSVSSTLACAAEDS